MFKTVVTDYIEENMDWENEECKKKSIEFECCQLKQNSEEEVYDRIKDADVIVVNMVKLPASLITRLEKCKLIIRHGIGYDNVDVEACTEKGIQFANQTDYCIEDVAEHAIALIFTCARKVLWSRATLDEAVESGEWDFSKLFPIHRLDGKTLGIMGLGGIGFRVYRKLKSFGFKFLGYDPYIPEERKKDMPEVEFVDMKTVFEKSDYITLHAPLTPDTKHMINKESLASMKSSAFLINTSRGPLVNSKDLADALNNNVIGGAAIDVFDVEPPKADLELFKAKNIVLTPHIGWASEEASQAIRQSILDDIISCSEGKNARCLVNKVKR